MSWFFFMDESGHDHVNTPYEVRGGFALSAGKLWPLIQRMEKLELDCFGAVLADYKAEIKGSKLLKKDRFKYAAQHDELPDADRRIHARGFLQAGLEKRSPARIQFTAYGQACLLFVDGILDLLEELGARIFAGAIPRGTRPAPDDGLPAPNFLRKDQVFLLERLFYFLESPREQGILVMDETEKTEDRRFVRRLQNYFTKTDKGRLRATWIVPSPFFVDSEMAIPVQIADILIYAINWGYRREGEFDATAREETASRYGKRLNRLKWRGDGHHNGTTFKSYGIFCVPDPYTRR